MMNRRPSQAAIHPAPGDRSSRVSRKGSEELKAEDAGIQGLTGKPSMARQTTWQSSTTNWATASKPTDLEELRQRHEMAVEMKRHRWRNYVYSIIASWFEAWASFANRNYMFDPSAQSLLLWDWLIAVLAIYSVTMCPLFVVFPQTRWPGYMSFEIALDALFVTVRRLAQAHATHASASLPLTTLSPSLPQDVCVRLRTAFLHHGYHVTVFSEVASNYLRGWLIPDALSAVPIDLIAAAATRATEPDWNTAVYLLRLLRVLRIGRLLRKMARRLYRQLPL